MSLGEHIVDPSSNEYTTVLKLQFRADTKFEYLAYLCCVRQVSFVVREINTNALYSLPVPAYV